MAAPAVQTIRVGVAFTSEAAASFRRCESDLGRRISTNSTYRDWDTQLRMFRAWEAWVAGTGPRPPHSKALHPSTSKHCLGLALDSDEWVNASFNVFMAERGWIRTAANDPSERHHFEYQATRDQHRNRLAGAGGSSGTSQRKKSEMHQARHPNGAISLIGELTYQHVTGNQYANNIPAHGDFIQYTAEGYAQQIIDCETRATIDAARKAAQPISAINRDAIAAKVEANLADDFARLSAEIDEINATYGGPTLAEIDAAVDTSVDSLRAGLLSAISQALSSGGQEAILDAIRTLPTETVAALKAAL